MIDMDEDDSKDEVDQDFGGEIEDIEAGALWVATFWNLRTQFICCHESLFHERVSQRASEWAQGSVQAKRTMRSKQIRAG